MYSHPRPSCSVIGNLWDVSLEAIERIMKDPHKKSYSEHHKLLQILTALREFYYCGGAGISRRVLDSERYKVATGVIINRWVCVLSVFIFTVFEVYLGHSRQANGPVDSPLLFRCLKVSRWGNWKRKNRWRTHSQRRLFERRVGCWSQRDTWRQNGYISIANKSYQGRTYRAVYIHWQFAFVFYRQTHWPVHQTAFVISVCCFRQTLEDEACEGFWEVTTVQWRH